MIEEKYRKEVWDRNKPYMDDPETVEDLGPCCDLCVRKVNRVNDGNWCDLKETCPVFQLWLSNEYLEWAR